MAELAEAGDEHFVARSKRVGERSFPGAGAARREDDDLPLFGLEDSLQPLVKRQGQLGEVRGPMILHGDMHRPQDAVRNIGRAGNEQEIASRLSRCRHWLRFLLK
jgi:hypothetical protein